MSFVNKGLKKKKKNVVEIGNLRHFKIALKSYMCIS